MQCVRDNRCKQQDDWNEIGQKMLEADAIVFGGPDYYGTLKKDRLKDVLILLFLEKFIDKDENSYIISFTI